MTCLVEPDKVWEFSFWDILNKDQHHVLSLRVCHMIHGDAELGHEDVVLDRCSAEKQDSLEAILNIAIDSIPDSASLGSIHHHQMLSCAFLEEFPAPVV